MADVNSTLPSKQSESKFEESPEKSSPLELQKKSDVNCKLFHFHNNHCYLYAQFMSLNIFNCRSCMLSVAGIFSSIMNFPNRSETGCARKEGSRRFVVYYLPLLISYGLYR